MVKLSPERRRAVFALLVTACVVVAIGYAGWAVQRTRSNRGAAGQGGAGEGTIGDDAAARALIDHAPTLMFRNEVPGDAWAEVALVPIATPAGSRAIMPLRCRRLHFSGGRGLCAGESSGFGLGFDVHIFGSDFTILHKFRIVGLPSRARVSPDGRYGAITVFVTGHSYAADFSTETTIFDLANGTKLETLEEFTVVRDGRPFKAVDFNFWGVTFASDSNRFFATLKTKGETYLVEGDIAARQMRVLHSNVECPSLSPDGTRIAFKKRVGGSLGVAIWRFHVLDLHTMTELPLAEPRSIDDQIEWLDDRFVLYGVVPDVWMVSADGSGEPRRYLSRAVSPTVVRTAIEAPLPRTARTLTLPSTDIGVAMSTATKVVPAGQELPYTVTVTNHGPAPASQIGVDLRLSPTVSVTSFAPVNSILPYGCYVKWGYLSCTVERLKPEESWTLQVIVKPRTTGLLRHRVTVSEAQPDAVPINNSATVEVNVVASS